MKSLKYQFKPGIILLFFFLSLQLFAQEELSQEEPSIRVSNFDMPAIRCDINGDTGQITQSAIIHHDIRFTVYMDDIITIHGEAYWIAKVWAQSPGLSTFKRNRIKNFNHYYRPSRDENGAGQNLDYLLVDTSIVNSRSKEINFVKQNWSAVAGTMVLPLKLRFEPFDFSTEVSLGPSFGARRPIFKNTENSYLTFLLSAGVSVLSLDSVSTDGELTETTQLPAFYTTVGAVLTFDGIDIGLFVGWDLLSATNENNWVYQSEPWIGIGLGISVFDFGQKEETKSKKSKQTSKAIKYSAQSIKNSETN